MKVLKKLGIITIALLIMMIPNISRAETAQAEINEADKELINHQLE